VDLQPVKITARLTVKVLGEGGVIVVKNAVAE
jgi:translation initiation factor 2 alpha subunit (eIF-2alpha)